MNKINFTAKGNFPLSSEGLDLMQNMILLNTVMAKVGGLNYILSGCVDDGTNVGDGVIVVNGEILPFTGAAKKAKITIVQTSKTLTAFGDSYPEAYVYRVAQFSDTGEYNWSDFVQVATNIELLTKVNSLQSEEPGFIAMWSGRIDRIPSNYLLANGEVVLTATYPNLAYRLGKENDESFALPDLRQKFIAGYDSTSDSYDQIGRTGGSKTVALTVAQMPEHTHKLKLAYHDWGDNAANRIFPDYQGTSDQETTSAGGGEAHENLPPYFVLAYLIKVK